jgi:hypothetical protein
MKSPRHMRIIEIDITNACDKRCSNCTRLCGHHKKPYFMDFDTFKRAVDSLDGYRGIRGIMGGEPTLHPEFERFIRYLGSKFPKRENPFVSPQRYFIEQVLRVEIYNFERINDGVERVDIVGAGMFSNMGASYKKHYEIITDILPFQGLNDHLNPIFHQSALITRRELGIPDDAWFAMRDACWLQNEWSAGITPKGAFFCEIAGVLDMLLDGPGGWKIEPGWWTRAPEEFGDQLRWCELCGFALDTFTRDSAEEVDDVSPEWHERLKQLQSPKLKSGRVNAIKIENGKIAEESKRENRFFSAAMPYIEHYEDRFNALNSVLFTHEFEFSTIPPGAGFGAALNKLLRKAKDWIVLRSENAALRDDFSDKIGRYVLNPGTLHYLDLSKSGDTAFVKNADREQSGFAALFSKYALSLRAFGFDRVAHVESFDEIVNMWNPEKIMELSSKIDEANKRLKICEGARYAVWGTGPAGIFIADKITGAGGLIALALDKSAARQGCDFYGTTIEPPESLAGRDDAYDVLIAAHYTRFPEIKREALSLGVPAGKIQFIYSLPG